MSLLKIMGIFMGAGLFIPIAFRFLWTWIEHSNAISTSAQYYIHNAMLLFWPASIINMGGTGSAILANRLFLISLILNTIAYGLLGFLVWLGLRHYRWLLVVLFIVLILLWWRMLTL